MTDLITRLTAATGPDRGLDAEIGRLIGLRVHSDDLWILVPSDMQEGFDQVVPLPRFTESVDAALTLRPEWANCWGLDSMPTGIDAYFSRNCVNEGHRLVQGEGKTDALALCVSALRARSGGAGG